MGRPIAVKPVPEEIILLLLAKEFHWTPEQVYSMAAKDVKAMMHMTSVFNNVTNQQNKIKSNKNK